MNEILQDPALLDPRSFESIAWEGVLWNSLEKLSEAIKNFDGDVTAAVLQDEITDLVRNLKVIKNGSLREYLTDINLELDTEDEMEN